MMNRFSRKGNGMKGTGKARREERMREVRKVRVVQSDTRGRVSLRKFTDNELHTVDVAEDGTLILHPVVLVPPIVETDRVGEFLDDRDTDVQRVAVKRPRGTAGYREVTDRTA